MSDGDVGAVGRDGIITLCCVTASIILTSIHSGPRGVSLPATRQTIPSRHTTSELRSFSGPNPLDALGPGAGLGPALQVRRPANYWFREDELEAGPSCVIAADVIDCVRWRVILSPRWVKFVSSSRGPAGMKLLHLAWWWVLGVHVGNHVGACFQYRNTRSANKVSAFVGKWGHETVKHLWNI